MKGHNCDPLAGALAPQSSGQEDALHGIRIGVGLVFPNRNRGWVATLGYRVDFENDPNAIASTAVVTWTFTCIDPQTGYRRFLH